MKNTNLIKVSFAVVWWNPSTLATTLHVLFQHHLLHLWRFYLSTWLLSLSSTWSFSKKRISSELCITHSFFPNPKLLGILLCEMRPEFRIVSKPIINSSHSTLLSHIVEPLPKSHSDRFLFGFSCSTCHWPGPTVAHASTSAEMGFVSEVS